MKKILVLLMPIVIILCLLVLSSGCNQSTSDLSTIFSNIYFTSTQLDSTKQATNFSTTDTVYCEYTVNTDKQITVSEDYYFNGEFMYSLDNVVSSGYKKVSWAVGIPGTAGTWKIQIRYNNEVQLAGQFTQS